jgi:hypothetical protein
MTFCRVRRPAESQAGRLAAGAPRPTDSEESDGASSFLWRSIDCRPSTRAASVASKASNVRRCQPGRVS